MRVKHQMNSVRKALVYTTADRYFSLAMNFLVVGAVSRLLTPSEIGISVTGTAIAGLVLSLREFASSVFLIQRPDLSRDDIRAAFTVMLALTTMISAVLFLSSPFVAAAYGESGLTLYLRVISLSILAEVVAAPIVALMRRDMAFGQVALVNITNTLASASTTIALAALGYSFMSFALAWLVSAILSAIVALLLRRQIWIFKPLFTNCRDILTFGSYNGLNAMLARMFDQVPYLVLGRIASFDAVAHFNRTLTVAQLPDKLFLASAMSVVLPAFSSEVRNGRDLKKPYLMALTYTTGVQWPALAVLGILAHPIVLFLYGDQWLEIVPLVQIATIALLFSFSFGLNYSVLLAVGAIRDAFLRSLIVWPVSALLLIAAAPFGLFSMALMLLVTIPFQAFLSLLFVRRHIRMSWRELVLSLWKSAVVTIGSAVGPTAAVIACGSSDVTLVPAAGAAALSGLGWVSAVWLVKHPVLHELSYAVDFCAWFNPRHRQAPRPAE